MKLAVSLILFSAAIAPGCALNDPSPPQEPAAGTSEAAASSALLRDVLIVFDNVCLRNLPNFGGFAPAAQESGMEVSATGDTSYFRHPVDDWSVSLNRVRVGDVCGVRVVSDNLGPLWPNIVRSAEQKTGGGGQVMVIPQSSIMEEAIHLSNGSLLYQTSRTSNNTRDGKRHKITSVSITPPISDDMVRWYMVN